MTEYIKTSITKQSFISTINVNGDLLEIGPFANPTFKGENIKYFDLISADQLREEAARLNLDVSKVPDIIHYVGSQIELRNIPQKFEAVYSSHVIEHTLDLIRHFLDVSTLLQPNGAYYLAIPDKRYCFDHFKNLATIGGVIDAYERNRTDYCMDVWIDRAVMSTHNDPRRHWQGDHGSLPVGQSAVNAIRKAIEEYKSGYRYPQRPHMWIFTPDSFAEIVSRCFALGYIDLHLKTIHPTRENSHEFYAILEKAG